MTSAPRGERKRTLLTLIADIPGLLIELVRTEVELLKEELAAKLKHAGVGVGLLVGAGAFAFFAIGVLAAAGILALAQVVPGWAAALIVAGVLLVIAAILVVVGLGHLKRASPTPTKTISSVRKDVRAIKGIGKRAQS